ncbi:hypothetical protein [Knoellia subterranea]|uniref:PknH-like extracellular domain-containing protein n=1 Tax=Knoellia subterranea KCTC 19937 TaxID=1385521 RepID=A0A0A0JQ50_9MICO|nr:hypothetical protein [Knoellia subterranea]KGN38864.1 hypothetical protein N803_07605 [Knoellia subterranea KCTC 19937]
MFNRTTRLAAVVGAAALAASILGVGPASAKPARSVLPQTMGGVPLSMELYNAPQGPTVLGPQACDPDNNPDASWARSRWVGSYWDGDNATPNLTYDAVISTWRDSRQAFTDVIENTGHCAFFGVPNRVDWPGQDPATHALFDNGGSFSAVIRDGRSLIAVDAVDWNGDGEAGDPDQRAAAIREALALEAAL